MMQLKYTETYANGNIPTLQTMQPEEHLNKKKRENTNWWSVSKIEKQRRLVVYFWTRSLLSEEDILVDQTKLISLTVELIKPMHQFYIEDSQLSTYWVNKNQYVTQRLVVIGILSNKLTLVRFNQLAPIPPNFIEQRKNVNKFTLGKVSEWWN